MEQIEILKDFGADPIGDGNFKMAPSGDIVTRQERDKRLEQYKRRHVKNDCLGMSWEQIEAKQGGKLYR
jgi:hypothetical protein